MNKVDTIIAEIEERTLLGAAYECMTDKAKEKFKQRLTEIVDEPVLTEQQAS